MLVALHYHQAWHPHDHPAAAPAASALYTRPVQCFRARLICATSQRKGGATAQVLACKVVTQDAGLIRLAPAIPVDLTPAQCQQTPLGGA